MQQNDLEKFILDNRDAFDDARPSLKLWTEIEKDLTEEKQTPASPSLRIHRPWYQVAAAVLILLTVGGTGGAYLSQQQSQAPTAQALIEQVAPDFSEMEQYYNERIAESYARLTTHTQDPEIDADLKQLDQAMAELREDLANAPRGQEEIIVQQMIDSYRLKLQILERILERIETLDSSIPTPDNNSNETNI